MCGVVLYRPITSLVPLLPEVWLWLEEDAVPYRIARVTMFCYGEKGKLGSNNWCPSGMLPALALDGRLITEMAIDILLALEATFRPLGDG